MPLGALVRTTVGERDLVKSPDCFTVRRLKGNVNAVAGRGRTAVKGHSDAECDVGGPIVKGRVRYLDQPEADQQHKRIVKCSRALDVSRAD